KRRRGPLFGLEDAGRWSLVRRKKDVIEQSQLVEHAARALLRRYGVVFWRITEREADWLPPWRDLLRCYRRLEARGEIRGGRFVTGMSGEQFAMPDAVDRLRETRRNRPDGRLVTISAVDPLNLTGIVTSGSRVRATLAARIV